jgi:tRNA pseudouridine38-40 synthase
MKVISIELGNSTTTSSCSASRSVSSFPNYISSNATMDNNAPTASASAPTESQGGSSSSAQAGAGNEDSSRHAERQQKNSRGKRKGNFQDSRMQHGGRGFRDDNKRHKKGDMGRGEYL